MATWTITPADASGVTTNSTGKFFLKNDSFTESKLYTISVTTDTNCSSATTYEVKKCETETMNVTFTVTNNSDSTTLQAFFWHFKFEDNTTGDYGLGLSTYLQIGETYSATHSVEKKRFKQLTYGFLGCTIVNVIPPVPADLAKTYSYTITNQTLENCGMI